MKNIIYLCFATILAMIVETRGIDWTKYDPFLLENHSDPQHNYARTLTASAKEDQIITCDDDRWFRYEDSCYIIAAFENTFDRGLRYCAAAGGNMLTVTTIEEYNAVMEHTSSYSYTWIGLTDTTYSLSKPTTGVHWKDQTNFDYMNLHWLIKPYNDKLNGYSEEKRCAAHYKGGIDAIRYVYWYPCDQRLHIICKKNKDTMVAKEYLINNEYIG